MNETDETVQVLHVDDEPDFADMAATFLEREDNRFNIETALSASEGLDRLSEDAFDCIISDYDMPGQNGIEFLGTVREDHPDLPFILFTGKGSEEVASEAISAGVSDYLQKGSGSERYELLANRILTHVKTREQEQELEEVTKLYQTVVEQSRDGIRIVQDGTVEFVNDRLAEMLGYPKHELLGMPVDEIIAPEFKQTVREHHAVRREGGTAPHYYQVDLETKSGDRCTVELSVARIKYREKPASLSMLRDITERKDAERELERFQLATEHAGHAIYITDVDGTIEYVNPAFEQVTGYASETAVGQTPRIMKSGEMADDYYDNLWNTVLTGEVWEEDIINRRKSGELYHAHQTIAPITDEAGEPEAFIAIQADITERKEHEEEQT